MLKNLGALALGCTLVASACSQSDDGGLRNPTPDAAALDSGPGADASSPDAGHALATGEDIFRGQCAACHTIGRGPTTRGPDLMGVTGRRPRM